MTRPDTWRHPENQAKRDDSPASTPTVGGRGNSSRDP